MGKLSTHTRIFLSAMSVVAIVATALSPVSGQDAAAEEGDYVEMFDGKTLDGWDGDPRLWTVRDGVIRGETTPENKANGNTFLIYQGGPYKDFELRVSFRCTNKNNSGIQYRSRHITGEKARNKWVVYGYQHEVRNEVDFPNVSGFMYGEGIGRGRICLVGEKAVWTKDQGKKVLDTLITEDEFKKLFRLDDWNDVVIVARGNHIQHYMNGRLILDFVDESDQALDEGIVALQLHAGAPMWAEFRDLKIKELDEASK